MRDITIPLSANNEAKADVNGSRTVFIKSGAPFRVRVGNGTVLVANGDMIDYGFTFDTITVIETQGSNVPAVLTVGIGSYRR